MSSSFEAAETYFRLLGLCRQFPKQKRALIFLLEIVCSFMYTSAPLVKVNPYTLYFIFLLYSLAITKNQLKMYINVTPVNEFSSNDIDVIFPSFHPPTTHFSFLDCRTSSWTCLLSVFWTHLFLNFSVKTLTIHPRLSVGCLAHPKQTWHNFRHRRYYFSRVAYYTLLLLLYTVQLGLERMCLSLYIFPIYIRHFLSRCCFFS